MSFNAVTPKPTRTKSASSSLSRAALRELFERAHAAGHVAATSHAPTPMRVVQRTNPFDAASPIVQEFPTVHDGACGFAWVTIRPANSRAAKVLKEMFNARVAYEGGMQYWISAYGQSVERKEAYADAFANVVREAGIKCFVGSRLD